MKLGEFIKQFIAPNAIIRLWQKIPDTMGSELKGTRYILYKVNDREVIMDWEMERDSVVSQLPVKHVTDILCDTYVEAVNIILDI